jgi:hypothetical protein
LYSPDRITVYINTVAGVVYSLSFYIVIYPGYLDPIFYGIKKCHKNIESRFFQSYIIYMEPDTRIIFYLLFSTSNIGVITMLNLIKTVALVSIAVSVYNIADNMNNKKEED